MFPRNCLKIKETSLPPHFWKDLLPFVFLVVTFNLSIPPFIRNDCLEEQLLGKVRFSRGAIILGEQTIICSVTQPSAFWIWFDNSILSFDSKIWFVNLIYGFDSIILGEHLPWHAILNFVDLINNQQFNQLLSNGTFSTEYWDIQTSRCDIWILFGELAGTPLCPVFCHAINSFVGLIE